MKKVWLILLAITLVFGLAFVGCGDDTGDGDTKKEAPEGFESVVLAIPTATTPTTPTLEDGSKLFSWTGDDFAKIKAATELDGSYLSVYYKASVDYAVGDIGFVSLTNAGPVIHGDGSNKEQGYDIPIEDLVLGEDSFTIHIFNGASLTEVILNIAPEGFDYKPHPKATAGATKIVVPIGGKPYGNGDVSRGDIAKIKEAGTGKLIFYFADDQETTAGIMYFAAKMNQSPHSTLKPGFGAAEPNSSGEKWNRVTEDTKTITVNVADIIAAMATDAALYTKLDINLNDYTDGIVYMEIVKD